MSSDLISRSALKERIQLAPNKNYETWDELYDSIIYEIDNAPTVDTSDAKYLEERDADAYESGYLQGHIDGHLKAEKDYATPQGEWLYKEIDPFLKVYGTCSNCLQRERVGNFCRNCGADMRGDKNG